MKVKNRRVNWSNYLIYIMLFFILLGLNGMIQFISAEFSWSTLTTATYWMKTATGTGSGLGAFIIFSMLRRDSKVAYDKKYNENLDDLNRTVKEGMVGPDLGEFCEIETREMKINSWRISIEYKIQKVSNSMNNRQLKAKRLIEEEDERFEKSWRRAILRSKVKRKLRKIEGLREQLTPEWIERNIDYVRIKHPSITQGEIINGHRGPANNNKLIDNNAMGMIFKRRLPMILITTTIQAFFNALVIIQLQGTLAMWIAIIVQLFTIFMNVAFGLNYGKTLFHELDENNLLVRQNYIVKYLVWKRDRKSAKAAPKIEPQEQ